MTSEHRVPVRAYGQRVFRVERRLYKVERWRIPVPGGIPLRAAAYALGVFLGVLAATRLPGLELLIAAVHPAYPYVLLPLAVGVLGSQVAPDGRATHRFARDWLTLRLRSRRRSAGRPLERPVLRASSLPFRADERAVGLRHAVIRGPVAIRFREPVAVSGRRGRWTATPGVGRPTASRRTDAVQLEPGERLEVRP